MNELTEKFKLQRKKLKTENYREKKEKSIELISEVVCGNEFFKYFIDGKVDIKLSVKAREKNQFWAKNLNSKFLSLKCVQTSVGVPFCYRLSLEQFKRLRNLTVYDFRRYTLNQ